MAELSPTLALKKKKKKCFSCPALLSLYLLAIAEKDAHKKKKIAQWKMNTMVDRKGENHDSLVSFPVKFQHLFPHTHC